jgi:hypothetical protein
MVRGSINEAGNKNSPFWDKNAKRPTKLTFVLIITMTSLILVWGIFDLIAGTHEIKVVIDYPGEYEVQIIMGPSSELIQGFGHSEYIYRLGEDALITVNVFRIDWDEGTMTASIYDDGELVRERNTTQSRSSIFMEYTVGE